ncbi:MAG: Maf family protein [Heliobacteriaceae bacterium]|nr:Maf family protein [Heliobacteriaceae bacterium]
MGKIILASQSPRRADILKKMNLDLEVIPSPYEEKSTLADFSFFSECSTGNANPPTALLDFIENLAYQKAAAVLPPLQGGMPQAGGIDEPALIIGADTVVVLDNKILGKPKDQAEAFRMLRALSGRKHSVVTAIAVINSATGEVRKNSTTSFVEFEDLTDEQINDYIRDFKPFDKAGSYGIQEMPEGYIKSYSGSLENIIGLCPQALKSLL